MFLSTKQRHHENDEMNKRIKITKLTKIQKKTLLFLTVLVHWVYFDLLNEHSYKSYVSYYYH